MWPVRKPTISARDSYVTCISRSRQPDRAWLEGFAERVTEAATQFEAAVQANSLHVLDDKDFKPPYPPASHTGPCDKACQGFCKRDCDKLVKVYTDRMAKTGAPGREIYETLRMAAHRCPLCGHRDVTTLDHHLPKSRYPFLAVTPANLIPACIECNTTKTDTTPAIDVAHTLHPYFDNIDEDEWLQAEVLEGSPAALRFLVSPPEKWSQLMATRARCHFTEFDLDRLYAVQAADELAAIAGALQVQFDAAGQAGVESYLLDQADSRSATRRNHWTTAMYRALARSPWYCAGGFALELTT
ncbi:HNH endonuclease signature motif containing protein [Micromonospora arborensis]|uniref:HNH endonuclease n=1 Tax=Micromonospora TaxID=1873 RepID=UPI0033C23A4D